MKPIAFVFALVLVLVASACGGPSSTISPSAAPSLAPTGALAAPSVAGRWSGTAADSGGQQEMGWIVTQEDGRVTGTMSFSNSGRRMMGNGTLHGTWDGQRFNFRIEIPNGGFGGMMASCALVLTGQATLDEHRQAMMGTYAGQVSGTMPGPGPWSGPGGGTHHMQPCGGLLNNGQFQLTR